MFIPMLWQRTETTMINLACFLTFNESIMMSFHDVALNVTAAHVPLPLGHKWFACDEENKETNDDDFCREMHAKTSVKVPEEFSGSIGDWSPWNIGTRSIFGLMGLTRILDDRGHALWHPVKITATCHFSCQAIVKGAASSTFQEQVFWTTSMQHGSSWWTDVRVSFNKNRRL